MRISKPLFALFAAVISIVFLPSLVSCKDTTPKPPRTDRIQLWGDGYAGSLGWSHRAGDKASDFKNVSGEFALWSMAHEADISIGYKDNENFIEGREK